MLRQIESEVSVYDDKLHNTINNICESRNNYL